MKKDPNMWSKDLKTINEETLEDLEPFYSVESDCIFNLTTFQLSIDHSNFV